MNEAGNPPRWERLAEAAAFAFRIHGGQMRKGTVIPYLSHLMAVSALVLEHGGDEEQAIAALLHDAIEDVGADLEPGIAERFGTRVARIVRDCSDTDVHPKPPWHTRKRAYLAHLEAANADALLVSACDKLHNGQSLLRDLRTWGTATFSRFNAAGPDTLWLYGALSEVYTRRMPGPLARELALTVDAMHRLAAEEGVIASRPAPVGTAPG
jgi:(p)ppGpp synthase/HD superfamily hydrolase